MVFLLVGHPLVNKYNSPPNSLHSETCKSLSLPSLHNSLLLGSSLSNASLLEVTVIKVLPQQLDVLLRYAKFPFDGMKLVMSRVHNKVLL